MSHLAVGVYWAAATMLICMAPPGLADAVTCPGGNVMVQGSDGQASAICAAAEEATEQLASCNLKVTHPVTVEATRTLPPNCNGIYHCDEDLIQVLPVEAYKTYASDYPHSPFRHLAPDVLFNSILRHELAHAALDAMPCPYDACPATQEFVAYTMQIRFLPANDLALFEDRLGEVARPVSPDGVNVMLLMLATETFIENAWAYLSEFEDPCALMADIVSGEVNFDVPLQ